MEKRDNENLKESFDVFNNNIVKLLEKHNSYLKSIKQTLNIFLFLIGVGITIALVSAFLLIGGA